jgi:hypothetical protein
MDQQKFVDAKVKWLKKIGADKELDGLFETAERVLRRGQYPTIPRDQLSLMTPEQKEEVGDIQEQMDQRLEALRILILPLLDPRLLETVVDDIKGDLRRSKLSPAWRRLILGCNIFGALGKKVQGSSTFRTGTEPKIARAAFMSPAP